MCLEGRGQDVVAVRRIPCVPGGATVRARGGKDCGYLLVGVRERWADGKDANRRRLRVEDMLMEGRGVWSGPGRRFG